MGLLGSLTAVVVAVILLVLLLHLRSSPRKTRWNLEHADGHTRLAVLVHGLLGRVPFESAIELARDALPDADILSFDYDGRILSNESPYEIANVIERQIHEAYQSHKYSEIILMGHSMGGMMLRKALIWGNGLEEDRDQFGCRGKREWVNRAIRFVSLATTNRGWSINPRPNNLALHHYIFLRVAEPLARLSRSGKLVLALQRGSPFVADARVQWIELSRGHVSDRSKIPQTIDLLGDRDDIVSRDDSMDLIAAKNTIFVTLQDTGHREIGSALAGGQNKADQNRREKVRHALRGELEQLDADHVERLEEDLSVERIVYVMHGIRDYGYWTDRLRSTIEKDAEQQKEKLLVVNQKYGHFPMAPFLLYWDRQKYVRLFMDEYTENRARFPRATVFDFVGHSNGTYILASALQTYKTLKVRRVYFAGSVVPKHYAWKRLADAGRVTHVANVVAAGDWVVALFPRFFEQIADWRNVKPVQGFLDIGSGGFRGFQDASDAKKRIENFQFADGSHGTGVDATNEGKLNAIARYIVSGDKTGLTLFRNRNEPERYLSYLSNLSWIMWLLAALSAISVLVMIFILPPVLGLFVFAVLLLVILVLWSV